MNQLEIIEQLHEQELAEKDAKIKVQAEAIERLTILLDEKNPRIAAQVTTIATKDAEIARLSNHLIWAKNYIVARGGYEEGSFVEEKLHSIIKALDELGKVEKVPTEAEKDAKIVRLRGLLEAVIKKQDDSSMFRLPNNCEEILSIRKELAKVTA